MTQEDVLKVLTNCSVKGCACTARYCAYKNKISNGTASRNLNSLMKQGLVEIIVVLDATDNKFGYARRIGYKLKNVANVPDEENVIMDDKDERKIRTKK
jgi:DNA-binding transcriptional regulator LsrR (DeoR family)